MNKLTPIDDGVWGAETSVNIGLGAQLPLRMTVLRDQGGLLLVSPIALDDALASEIDALGEVRAIVGPNRLHHLHLSDAKARYPAARLLGAPGLASKRRDLHFDGELDSGPLSDEIEALRIEGAEKLSEVVLLHRPSRTLVVTDATFNISRASGMSWLLLKVISGTFGRFEQSRLIRTLTADRKAAARSVETLLSWPFERVVMAHGDIVEHDAAARLRAALWWWLSAPRAAAHQCASTP